ncbi:hypothetical protein SNE40_007789 [Patella caerulea]|uniref:Uncharacterized protein n=1 Tax=Patella caerulea TaxID=87958 RepID=A0AAN8K5A4_PATCE
MSVFGFITSELTRGYRLERDESKYAERRERVYTFMKTPRELEKFCAYGFFQCVDAFLFLFTFLPLRILMALVRLFTHPCGFFSSGSGRYLESAQICDLLKGLVFVMCCFIVNYIDTSMMYHLVRGQAVIKLYVLHNMLDVADKLFSGFGQDILDAMFWTATEPRGRRREHVGTLPHFILSIIYVIIHTLIILFQAAVLNVAFNSHSKALLTIMMSNNFVEIKGNLFKRLDRNHLFHISCGDIKERFHYAILLSVVFIRNMTEFSWNPDHVWVILPDALLVLLSEFIVDWVKHAFVLKFNKISSEVYQEFTYNLASDMISSRQKSAFTDHSDLLSRKMGFTPLPLGCLLVRVCSKSFKISGIVGIALLICLYLCLLTSKILISIVLLGYGCKFLKEKGDVQQFDKEREIDSQVIPAKDKRSPEYEQEEHKFDFASSSIGVIDVEPRSDFDQLTFNVSNNSDQTSYLSTTIDNLSSEMNNSQMTESKTDLESEVIISPRTDLKESRFTFTHVKKRMNASSRTRCLSESSADQMIQEVSPHSTSCPPSPTVINNTSDTEVKKET